MSQLSNKWRTSASLILVSAVAGEDYQLLMLKRSDVTSMAMNHAVFPGGMLDTQGDENVAWLDYLEQFGVPQEALRSLVLINDQRPSILAPQGTGCYDRFFKRSTIWAREITLRLTAVRECFEEVGILLCRNREQLKELGAIVSTAQTSDGLQFDREAWQRRVHNHPADFLELCRELQVVPDLWALHEWSAWASPAPVKKGHQTMFFMAFVDEQPRLLAEPSEVKECLWRTPLELLRLHRLGEVWLMPPQIYELTRLLGIKSYRKLFDFSANRSRLGITLFLPVGYACSDGVLYVLPGDDAYLPEPHLATEFVSLSETTQEFIARAKYLHRYKYDGVSSWKVHFNLAPFNGHLMPRNLPAEVQKL
ncbi:CG10195 [Drosophila busckii]|uniref:CG10195 n=1 Tax=Drosophila busckii TaxID=30019 RepID=A0A0M3QTU6_DROBS|nr:CG10195 [Drosophila busckii]